MLTNLKSLAQAVTPIALDIYDREDPESLLPLLAQRAENPDMEKELLLEWWTAFPELRRWLGERTVQKAFQDSMRVKSEPYEVTMEFDRRDAERKSSLAKAGDLAQRIARAFVQGKVMLAYGILRANALAYDGQNFFDEYHQHPNGQEYSNWIGVTREDPANPTVVEVRSDLKAAMSLLMENRLVRNSLVASASVEKSLVVIARSQGTWSALRDLNTEERIGPEPNRFRNTFTLLRDFDPPADQENSFDVIEALPNGPRPVVFVATREPSGLEFDESKAFSHNLIPFGMDGEYGVAAGFPQTAVRVEPQAEEAPPVIE